MGVLKVYNPLTATWVQLVVGAKGDPGSDGAPGVDGEDGLGVPAGGATGQFLRKVSAADNDTEWADLTPLAITTLSATPHVLLQTNAEKLLEVNEATPFVITVPTNAAQGITIPSLYTITRIGAGVVTIAAATGVTLNGVSGGSFDINVQYGAATLYKRGTNNWVITGAIEATP